MLLRRYYWRIDATSADITSPLFTPLLMPPKFHFIAMFILFHLLLFDFIFIIVVITPITTIFAHSSPSIA
jgi:hypothetical protein